MNETNGRSPHASSIGPVGACVGEMLAMPSGLSGGNLVPASIFRFVRNERSILGLRIRVERTATAHDKKIVLTGRCDFDYLRSDPTLDFTRQRFERRESNGFALESCGMDSRWSIGRGTTLGKMTGAIQAGGEAMPTKTRISSTTPRMPSLRIGMLVTNRGRFFPGRLGSVIQWFLRYQDAICLRQRPLLRGVSISSALLIESKVCRAGVLKIGTRWSVLSSFSSSSLSAIWSKGTKE